MGDKPSMLGLRHVALCVESERFESTVAFYCEGLGLRVEWRPDPANVYLGSGADNLALHRVETPLSRDASVLDHIGFCVASAREVERWHGDLTARAGTLQIDVLSAPRLHRDGATSFYVRDPAGNRVQIIHLPGIER